jgi:alpha-tubulin suppressor-like RCC1 family protein
MRDGQVADVLHIETMKFGRGLAIGGLGCLTLATVGCGEEATGFTQSEYRVASAGNGHTCNVFFDGVISCWGWNERGQLGDGTKTNSPLPIQIGHEAVWQVASAGEHHTCSIRNDSWLWCWGWNEHGQLGTGTIEDQTVPLQAEVGEQWAAVSTGATHTCAIRKNGSLWCWGNNNVGQIGNGKSGALQKSLLPEQIGTESDWKTVHAGNSHSCGLRGDGILFCWGNNVKGQLGDGTTVNKETPREVALGFRWKELDAGYFHTCGISDAGQLWCWGENISGQLGDGTMGNSSASPVQVSAAEDWVQVALGDYHTCARKEDNTIWCWGDNQYGQLGNGAVREMDGSAMAGTAGSEMGSPVPTRITADGSWIDITSGNDHTCGLIDDDTLWCWGRNDYGQLGEGSYVNRSLPVQVAANL